MKKIKIPHTFTIVFVIVVVCAAMTWIIPGGEFERKLVEVNGIERNIVIPNSFQNIDSTPQTWQIFTAFFKGFERTSNIIVFILMIGGAFWIVNYTNTINIAISNFLKVIEKVQKNKIINKIGVNNIVIIMIMTMFSMFGAIFGMSEETIAFIVIFVPLAISMGYDSIVGLLISYVAAHTGFAGAILNPFTIGIAQGLAGVPTFSGIEYRIICWVILTTIAIVFTILYARKVHKNPQKSIMFEADKFWREQKEKKGDIVQETESKTKAKVVFAIIAIIMCVVSIKFPLTEISIGESKYSLPFFPIFTPIFILMGIRALRKNIHNFIIVILATTIIMLVIGVLGYQWYIKEIAALFFAMGIVVGLVFNLSLDNTMRLFIEGCKDIMTAAIIVGMAGGIIIILEDGKIIDTLLFAVSQAMTNTGKETSIAAMYMIQNMLNIIIPSGSAKAALTIPMMVEFSDIVGISRQLTIMAFQFGDGFTNMITPTSGVLIACLGVGRVPYEKWVKFILPFILILFVVGFLLLLPPLYIHFNGF